MDLDVLRSLGAGVKQAGQDVSDIILKKYMMDRQEKLEKDLQAAKAKASMEEANARIKAETDIANANREVDRYRILSNLQQNLIGNLGEAEGRFLYNMTTTQNPMEQQAAQVVWNKYNTLKQKRFSGQKITPQDTQGIPPNLLAELETQAIKLENMKAQTQAYGNAYRREQERLELAEKNDIAATNKMIRQRTAAAHQEAIKQLNMTHQEYAALDKQFTKLKQSYDAYCQKNTLNTPDRVLADPYASNLLQQMNDIRDSQQFILESADRIRTSLEKEAEIEPLQETPVKNLTDVLGQYSKEDIKKMTEGKYKYPSVPNRSWPLTQPEATTKSSEVVSYDEAVRKMKEEHPEMSIEEIKKIIDNYLNKKK